MFQIRVRRVLVGCFADEEVVLGFLIDDGDVHVARIAWKTLARLGHEAWLDAVLRAKRLDDEFEEGGLVCHGCDFTEFEGLSQRVSGCASVLAVYDLLTASNTPGPLSVCQPSMPQLNFTHVSNMP